MDLYDLIGNLKDVGFYDILLPWALFFAIVYGLLTSVGPFSTKKEDGKEPMDKSIPAIISMAVAFFTIAYTPFGMNFGLYLAEMFGKSGTILAGLLVLSLFLGMAGIKLPEGFGKEKDKRTKTFLVIVAIITVIIYFTTGFELLINFSSPTFAEDTIVTFLVILALAGGIYMMMKGGNGDDTKGNDKKKGENENDD